VTRAERALEDGSVKSILITGGTGFIGRPLVRALLERGDTVGVLTRRTGLTLPRGGHAVHWDPSTPGPWLREVSTHHALIHLAGQQAVGARYSVVVKQSIAASRIDVARMLVDAMADAERRPDVFVCASAVGYYGPRPPEEAVDESSAAGDDFLADVCKRWEAAAREAEPLGVRVVRARFGVVLGRGGGPLERLALPFKLFAGGPIGSGKQVLSWIHVDDAVRAVLAALDDSHLRGPVNVVSPHPVTYAELAECIGAVLRRPSWLRVPAVALRLLFGEGSRPMLGGQRVFPRVLESHGFAWRYPTLRAALDEALGREAA
jgi:uncharacterized protein (TIGR01777 family)